MPQNHASANGRLPRCIEFQTDIEGRVAAIEREVVQMAEKGVLRDQKIDDLRLSLARWGGIIAAVVFVVGILGPVIAR